MHVRATVAAVVLGVAAAPPDIPGPPEAALFTAPQADGWRSAIDPPSVSVSADGRFVAFGSYARLAPEDRNNSSDIYVLDRDTGRVTIESAAPAPVIHAEHARISGDGRYVVFESTAAPSDDARGGFPRSCIVLRDRWSGATRVVSAGPNGEPADAGSRSPSISADGRVVAFASAATNLVRGDDANGVMDDTYLFDVATGAVSRASVDSAGRQPASGASFDPSLSADGRYVAFTSTAPFAGGEAQTSQVYVRDTLRGETSRVSVTAEGNAPNGRSAHPTISGDGRYVAFASDASNLIPGDRNRVADVFLRDRTTGSTTLVSRSARRGAGNGASANPAISPDGRMVVFQSEASDLVCAARCAAREDFNLVWDVFVYDCRTGIMSGVSGDPAESWMEPSSGPAIDAGGRVLAFSSRHPIDARDTDGDLDLFIRVAPGPEAGALAPRGGRQPLFRSGAVPCICARTMASSSSRSRRSAAMTPAPKPMTVDDYFKTPETLQPMELIYGVLRVADSPMPRHQSAVFNLALALNAHARERRLGQVWISPLDVVFDDRRHLILQPDLFFISNERAWIVTDRVRGAPDLVVEVLSPHPRIGTADERVGWFAEYGVRECWLVHQDDRSVVVVGFEQRRVSGRAAYAAGDPIASQVLPEFRRSFDEMMIDRDAA